MADPTFTLPTLDELTELAVAYQGNLIPEDDLSRASDEWARLRVLALMAADINYNGSVQLADAMLDSATGTALDRWGIVLGIERNGPTVVTGAAALRIRGVVGATYTVGLTLTHGSGATYALVGAGSIPAGGYVDVDVTSISTGSGTRLAAKQILRFDSPPTDIEQNADLVLDLVDGGEDAESDAAYRVRLIDAMARRKLGNTLADWESWARDVDGIVAAYVYPGRAGLGTVDVAALKAGHGDARALTGSEVTALQVALDAKRPASATARALTTVATAADVRIHLDPMPGKRYAPDWATGGVDFEASAWNATTRVLKLSATRPVSLKAGHRIVVNTGTGSEAIVAALGPAADEVTLRDPVPSGFAPVATDRVWPGGPLVAPIRLAVSNWIDTLGPALGSYGAGWKGALYLGDVFLIVQTSPGVLDSDIRTLADADFVTIEAPEYLFPDDDTIGYLKPGRILAIYTSTL